MSTRNDLGLDLRAARAKSGLTQADCAHLISCDPTKLTRLEGGKYLPDLKDTLMQGLIFGRTFEGFFAHILTECRDNLVTTLESLPDCPPGWAGRHNRLQTLNRLAADLADQLHRENGRAYSGAAIAPATGRAAYVFLQARS